MKLSVETRYGTVDVECLDDPLSHKITRQILEGRVYPQTDLVPAAEIVMDVGANIGAAALYFSRLYPAAEVFAFEPLPAAYQLLEANARTCQRVHPYDFGLSSTDDEVPLYVGAAGTATSSVFPSAKTSDASERIKLRSVSEWLNENAIRRVDVLKIDTEGCEVPILVGMQSVLPAVKLVHLEYHSEADRKEVDRLLGDTHVLFGARAVMGTGNVTYLSNDVLAAAMVERGLGPDS